MQNVDLFINGKWQKNKAPIIFVERARAGQTLYAAPAQYAKRAVEVDADTGREVWQRTVVGFDRANNEYFISTLEWSTENDWTITPHHAATRKFKSVDLAIEIAGALSAIGE